MSVVGCPGSGKSTLGRALARQLGVPFVELDGIFHQPGWHDLPREEFQARVTDIASTTSWVIDGNYSAVRDLVWARADTVVWLDLPRRTVMRRVVRRTLRRVVLREELWNGNREPWANFYRWDRNNMLRMAWARHTVLRQRYTGLMADPAWSHLRFIHLRSPQEVTAMTERAT